MKGERGKLIQIDAAVSSGSIGGGVFDEDAHLIGVIKGGLKDAQNLNFAIPTEWIKDLTARNRDRLADALDSGEVKRDAELTPPVGPKTEAWMPKPGDRWTYAIMSGTRRVRTVLVQITESSGNTVREHITVDGFKTFRADRSVVVGEELKPVQFQDPLVLPGGYQMAEMAPYLAPSTAFHVGQRWDAIPAVFWKSTVMFQVRVVGRETVRVPAGEFNAWKIEATGDGPPYQTNVPLRIVCTFWYASDLLRSVKMRVLYDSTIATSVSQDVYELVAFEPSAGNADSALRR